MANAVPDPSAGTIGLDTAAHVGMSVSDLDRSVAFYRAPAGLDFLGPAYTFRTEEVSPPDVAGTEVAYFTDPGGTNLEIIAPRGGFARPG
ncbi:VOC family protein [Plantactinospora sp. DSM 117369]